MTERSTPSFGALLRTYRERAGLSQEALAEKAGLTAKAISALERGERRQPYLNTVRALADALGLSEQEYTDLLASRGRRAPASSSMAPSPTTVNVPLTLPVPLTPLLGRDSDVNAVCSLLSYAGTRLVTLTGLGGVGKTRLALEVARHLAASFPDGVVFVALAPIADPQLILPTIAQALGIREAGGQELHDLVYRHLQDKTLLLVLDNYEHVLAGATEVTHLLSVCPSVKVLATSRAPLRLRGEQEYPVPPLAVPDSTHILDVENVRIAPAAALFMERAQEANPAFVLTQHNVAAIAVICRHLAGLPLALELAATRIKTLGPTELLARLDRALEAGGARDLPARQRTMRATLDWSYDLLSEAERVLFRRVSVFAGGWTLEAAETVGAGGQINSDAVLDLLDGLVAQSLVTVSTPPGDDDVVRYGMLEPVRQYAQEQLLGSDEEQEVRRRHAAWSLSFAKTAASFLNQADQVQWLNQLEREHDNLRAAMAWAISSGDVHTAAHLGWAQWLFWWIRGHYSEGRRWMDTLLDMDIPPNLRAIAASVAGTMAYTQGDLSACEQYLSEGREMARRAGDKVREAHATHGLWLVELDRRNVVNAKAWLQESVRLYRELGNESMLSLASTQLGTLLLDQGEYEAALQPMKEGLALARKTGDRLSTYIALYNLAQIDLSQGNYRSAAHLLKEGVELSEEIGDQANLAYFLEGMAVALGGIGQADRSARLFGAAQAQFEAVGAPVYKYYLPNRTVYDRVTAEVHARLGEKAFEVAQQEGREMTRKQAATYALIWSG